MLADEQTASTRTCDYTVQQGEGFSRVIRTLAIDIGGTNFSLGLFADAQITHSETRPTARDGGPLQMLSDMASIVQSWQVIGAIDRIGIGFGGPVHFPSQRVIYSTHVEGWDGFDLIGEVSRRFDAPAIVDRDTMVGALGEGFYGAGRNYRPLFYVTISTGIGGGLLLQEGLYRGADSFACELGHHCVLPNGPVCLCGSNGCLERMCSGLWLERDYGIDAKTLLQDEHFVESYVVNLARGLKNTIMFINPARIVIGGGISRAGDRLFLPLREELRRQMPGWSKARIDVVPAALEGKSVLWGALKLAEMELA